MTSVECEMVLAATLYTSTWNSVTFTLCKPM